MTRFLLIFLFIFFILPLLGRLFFSLAAFFLLRAVKTSQQRPSGNQKGDFIDVSGKVVK